MKNNSIKNKDLSKETGNQKSLFSFLNNQWVIGIFSPIIAAIIIGVFGYFKGVLSLPNRLDILEKDLSNKIDVISKDIENVEKNLTKRIDYHEERLNSLEQKYSPAINIDISGMAKFLSLSSNGKEEMVLNAPYIDAVNWVAVDRKSGEDYTSEELMDQRIFTSYNRGDEDTLFLGQYNENYHWDGECLINVYKKGKLSLVMEAYYIDGSLISYMQALSDKNSQGDKIWIISKRINKGDFNEGESWSYYRMNDIELNIDIDDCTPSDLFYSNRISSINTNVLEGYYYGNTRNGYFSDNTGKSFLIKFFKDGTVRTLYCGNFENGFFDDKSGDAWYITKNEKTDYMYYKGYFQKGHPVNNKGSQTINPLTKGDIDNIIDGYNFNIQLMWKGYDEGADT